MREQKVFLARYYINDQDIKKDDRQISDKPNADHLFFIVIVVFFLFLFCEQVQAPLH
jgi:hypothetical protein